MSYQGRGESRCRLDAVAEAPPPQYSGGGKWEAMHGPMGGYFEVRASGPGREQFRLFCVLRTPTTPSSCAGACPHRPSSFLTGLRKPWRTKFNEREYRAVRALGDDHMSSVPWRIAE